MVAKYIVRALFPGGRGGLNRPFVGLQLHDEELTDPVAGVPGDEVTYVRILFRHSGREQQYAIRTLPLDDLFGRNLPNIFTQIDIH